jgi:hypothetical protein
MSTRGRSGCSSLASHRGPWKILHSGYLIRCHLYKQGPAHLIIIKSLNLQIVLSLETKARRAPRWSRVGETTYRKREAPCWPPFQRVWNLTKKTVSLNSTSRALRKPSTLCETSNSNKCTSICIAIHSCLINRAHRFSKQRPIITRRRVSLRSWTTPAGT